MYKTSLDAISDKKKKFDTRESYKFMRGEFSWINFLKKIFFRCNFVDKQQNNII